ncbi:YciI family protein [Cryobacterium sp. PH31-L1]|uniref:YciI family protein n=1 Tax=Cryobacterium sp. PH31-L1 TaxID=3046199 RepID=UPI0024BA31FC|nr:YciI family protein [Cryobacterium sp. PH31-L1]MDJ0378795.1 YciI family protein [Cryobacterium sp. PH31-L1]
MSQYIVLIYEDQARYATMSPEEWGALIDAHNTFRNQISELGGALTGGEALASVTTAKTIKGRGMVTDGPFVESEEAFGGYYSFEARDLDHAVEIAKLCPAPFGGVEVRPLVDPSTNPF